MASVNKAFIIGNVGKDPDIRQAGSTKVATLTVATSEKFTDKSGQPQQRTEWHTVVVWDKAAEFVEKYVKKGDSVYVEGKIATRQDGQKRYVTEIISSSFQRLTRGAVQQDTRRASAPVTQPTDDPNGDLPF